MIYDKEGFKKWLSEAELVDSDVDHSHCGNVYEERIYKKDGKFYYLSACNDTINCKWHEGGYKKGYNEFEPIEVEMTTREEEVRYTRHIKEFKTPDGDVLLELG